MKITVQSIHFDADEKLVAYIEEKVGKLDTFFDKIIDSKVYLKLEKNDSRENKVVEIKVNVPSEQLVAKENAAKFEEATDIVVESLKKQLKKFKEKTRDH